MISLDVFSEHIRLRPPAAAGHRRALPVTALHHALLRGHPAAAQPRVEAVLRQRRGEAAEAGAGSELPHSRREGEAIFAALWWWPGASFTSRVYSHVERQAVEGNVL